MTDILSEKLVAAYVRGVEWRKENPDHTDYPFRFKAARDYADAIMGEPTLRAAANSGVVVTDEAAWVSCPGCNGTGDQGGNPSYGACDDCGGSGKIGTVPALTATPQGDYEIVGTTSDGVDVLKPATASKRFTPEDVRASIADALTAEPQAVEPVERTDLAECLAWAMNAATAPVHFEMADDLLSRLSLFVATAPAHPQPAAVLDGHWSDPKTWEGKPVAVTDNMVERAVNAWHRNNHVMLDDQLRSVLQSVIGGYVPDVKPLDLANIMREAFLAGRGLKGGDKLSEEDTVAWANYAPQDSAAYDRLYALLNAALATKPEGER